MSITCEHCRVRQAKINTNISAVSSDKVPVWRCFHCYGVEQKFKQTQDWRDSKCETFASEHGLVRRQEETIMNLINRCKIFLRSNGFNFKL